MTSQPAPQLRLATAADTAALPALERRACRAFHEVQMPEVAEDRPPTPAELTAHANDGRLLVAEVEGRIAGYLVALVFPETLHVEQVTVDPEFSGRGIGAALLNALPGLVPHPGAAALTLTTFREVPWNAPYYARLGFVEVPEVDWDTAISAVVAEERNKGLWHWPRVVMARSIEDDRPRRRPRHRARG